MTNGSAYVWGNSLSKYTKHTGIRLLSLNIKANPETLMVRRLDFINVLNLCFFEQHHWGGTVVTILSSWNRHRAISSFAGCQPGFQIIPSRLGGISMTLKLICWPESMSSALKFWELCCGLKVGAEMRGQRWNSNTLFTWRTLQTHLSLGYLIGYPRKYSELE